MATITDVAALAGVSTATVSRAFNGKSTVDPLLAERVFAAAGELDYRPNGLARNLRKQVTTVLALIVSDVENPFFTSVARGMEDTAQTAGYSVVLCNSDDSADKERRYLEVALQERMAGVVISPTGPVDGVRMLRERRVPVVAVDRPVPGDVGGTVDEVLVDSRSAAREATEHLIAQGYERIGCVTGPAGVATADERLDGYRDALTAAGRPAAPQHEWHADYRPAGARDTTRVLLDGPDRPDALLVANSAMAIGVLEAMNERGLRPGRDLGLIAFDDAPWTRAVDPPLSVVAQPAYDIGSEAARLLLTRIAAPDGPAASTLFEAHLVTRGSSQRG
ncbi:LacI family transcriptional regulator [Pseudonocardia sediminis]|uniref:LacI family transcriptional regulator n=1 Tax=Pseudonocardia sediminis TaxID=1397368 RepID=A0A4Q7UYA7_PSEST|nr:LacI family DNA-binding transcriptional regulator [Pseudonocardia sediminis]RZT87042.1 LacI family transcriptional regulator [Pseudonocardia sediminis]